MKIFLEIKSGQIVYPLSPLKGKRYILNATPQMKINLVTIALIHNFIYPRMWQLLCCLHAGYKNLPK
jgi:hypothetical protein